MNEDPNTAAIERIEQAMARIERAARSKVSESHTLVDRHAVLRARVGDAIGALDSVIAHETGAD